MDGPLTSAMVPVYNGERCLGSAPHTMQSYHVVQVIDIDDATWDEVPLPDVRREEFEIDDFSVHFTGICAECRRKA